MGLWLLVPLRRFLQRVFLRFCSGVPLPELEFHGFTDGFPLIDIWIDRDLVIFPRTGAGNGSPPHAYYSLITCGGARAFVAVEWFLTFLFSEDTRTMWQPFDIRSRGMESVKTTVKILGVEHEDTRSIGTRLTSIVGKWKTVKTAGESLRILNPFTWWKPFYNDHTELGLGGNAWALDFQITQLTEQVTTLQEQNKLFRAENEKVKQHYKELYDSIKITRAKHIEQTTALLTDNENLKAQIHENLKCITMDSVKPRVLAPGRYAIDVEPIPPRNRNNREVHLDYLKHLKESVETLREIVEEAKVERPLDSSLAFACLYTKHSQELLEYVIGTCPKDFNQRDKNHAATPLTRKKQVTFEDQCETSNSNTHKRVEQLYIQKTNVLVPPSTGVNSCTDASGSQPRSNTKKNRILPAKSVNTKQVEEHPRTNKSSLKTTNRVDSSISSKRTVINSNSHSVCQTCNKCLISANHDVCVVTYLHSVNASPSVKNVVRKVKQVWIPKQVKQVWKATGKVLTSVGSLNLPERMSGHCLSNPQHGTQPTIGDPTFHTLHLLRFGNDHFGAIMGYGDYVVGDSVISRNKKSSPICLQSKASKHKSWLWHRCLNHLNFGTINDLARKDLNLSPKDSAKDSTAEQKEVVVPKDEPNSSRCKLTEQCKSFFKGTAVLMG
ncbi:integrase, catalytic region, zinc finger, CCHC-type containing protein [Tanacetum coccineum]